MKFPPTALAFVNLGGPRDKSEIVPFLTRLFSDRETIKFPVPATFQPALAGWIAKTRLKKIWPQYETIGGGSPQYRYSLAQMEHIAKNLKPGRPHLQFELVFRFSFPLTEEVVPNLLKNGVNRILTVPFYPHYSSATTGSSVNELKRRIQESGKQVELELVPAYYNAPFFVEAWSQKISSLLPRLKNRSKSRIVFSAHGLPQSIIDKGDPYLDHIKASVAGIMDTLGHPLPHMLAFQSRVGPIRWLRPNTLDVLRELPRQGVDEVIVVPISFVSDHIETLYEIDVTFADLAAKSGIRQFLRAEGLNEDPFFLDGLARWIEDHMKSIGWANP